MTSKSIHEGHNLTERIEASDGQFIECQKSSSSAQVLLECNLSNTSLQAMLILVLSVVVALRLVQVRARLLGSLHSVTQPRKATY
ncbi:hypothetical protein OWV82_013818 [Melia azedarach]|uniref:Uncharacterized protein n=1 Tax=Melia azedarach TaxID=155640 RepID=A0ACC1XXK1_MELAZ|nr:hypothetical protein OWV82_013818 [Melia azedarach]